MVLIEPRLFQSEWFMQLSVGYRYLYLYLLSIADTKSGSFEWNERFINFCAATGMTHTKEDVIKKFGGRIVEVPGHSNTLIFVDYIWFNYLRNGGELKETVALHRGILKELNRLGISIDWLNEMAKHKVEVVADDKPVEQTTPSVSNDALRKLKDDAFARFWGAYPKCSRKVNGPKVKMKIASLLGDDEEKASVIFSEIMHGLDNWKHSPDWDKNGGEFICAPLVWLNQRRWEAPVKRGTYNGSTSNSGKPAVANYKSEEADGLF